jgi:hypothetical protein
MPWSSKGPAKAIPLTIIEQTAATTIPVVFFIRTSILLSEVLLQNVAGM